MITYNEILNGLTTIRKVLDQIEVKGCNNAKALAVADEHSRILVDAITKAVEEIQNGSKNEPGDGEIDAGNDTGLS